MRTLQTPDDRFLNLAGFPFAPHYAMIGDLRVHYLDEGPADGPTVLLLHGEPTWSYLYRKMIPVLVGAGFRTVVPDLIGFGRSDKLADRADYSYAFHVDIITRLLADLGLARVTFFGQDWGGLIGLRVVAENPGRFSRVAVGNTGLPNGKWPINPAFFAWRDYSQKTETFRAGKIVHKSSINGLTPEEIAGYDAPFPDPSYQAGARAFPMLVPTSADDPAVPANLAAWEVLRAWTKPFLTAFSDKDPIMAGGEKVFQRLVPGAAGQPHVTIQDAGHFLQEDKGAELAEVLVDFIRRNPD